MSNHWNQAHAWTISSQGLNEIGITWVRQIPTMVLGISISNSLGQEDSISVVCASATLDGSCMRLAQDVRVCSKSETVDGAILISLVESLLMQYFLHNNFLPKRILVYRAGVSEGAFSRFRIDEIKSIKKGYKNFVRRGHNGIDECSNNCDSGCVHCCPAITFVACMTRNSVKIVPANPSDGVGIGRNKDKFNVHSGTVVDSVIVDAEEEQGSERAKLYSEKGDLGYDFLLIAHGSGKGTSKPVHYRMIMNENAGHKQDEGSSKLSKELLEQATYEMSFQYSTATKAVRLVPVLYYSSRCAETVLKYLRHLQYEGLVVPKGLDEYVTERDGSSRARMAFIRSEVKVSLVFPCDLPLFYKILMNIFFE